MSGFESSASPNATHPGLAPSPGGRQGNSDRDDGRVIVVGAGPVGLAAAVILAQAGIPVAVLEAGTSLAQQSRASTFHPPTLDMLDRIGAAEPLIAQGLVAPTLQYRTRAGAIATFDFGDLADVTAHPYRLQAEQYKLTRILLDLGLATGNLQIAFDSPVRAVTQDEAGVAVEAGTEAAPQRWRAKWLIGADGASSVVRKQLGIAFDGFTWPERFLVVSTPFDFAREIPDLASVSYVADPEQWFFYLQVPGFWRMMFPVPPDISDGAATGQDYIQDRMARLLPGRRGYEVAHTTVYRVHQRVAAAYGWGRTFLAGDAAHVNNPLGGMGMNGGIHDAVDIAGRLVEVWHGRADATSLGGYERQRRQVNIEYVQAQTIRNKQNLEATDPEAHEAFKRRLREIAADKAKTRAFLLDTAMFTSLRRAAEL